MAPSLAAQTVAVAPATTPPPFKFTVAYTADFLDDAAGGLRTGGEYVDLVKLTGRYDGTAGGRPGFTGLISMVDLNGGDFTTRNVGGVQTVSASEAQPQAVRLYEAWVRQDLPQGKGGVKVGLIDINTTFDTQPTASLFMNASQGIGPDLGDTGRNGPSDYPTPTLGVTAFYRPVTSWTARIGVFNGVAGDLAHRSAFLAVKLDGALVIGQIENRFGDNGRVELGAWTYSAAFPSLDQLDAHGDPRAVHGNDGVYGLIEGRLIPKAGDAKGGLSGWVRVGVANGDINTVANYLGAGLVYTGPFKGRDADQVGFAIARAGFGRGARYAGALQGRDIGASETDLEATYRYAFKDWLNIQPDVQYVISPSGDRHIPNALVVGLRLAFSYSK